MRRSNPTDPERSAVNNPALLIVRMLLHGAPSGSAPGAELHTPEPLLNPANRPTNPSSNRSRSRQKPAPDRAPPKKLGWKKGRGRRNPYSRSSELDPSTRKWQISRRSDLRFGVGGVVCRRGGGCGVLCECFGFFLALFFFFVYFFSATLTTTFGIRSAPLL